MIISLNGNRCEKAIAPVTWSHSPKCKGTKCILLVSPALPSSLADVAARAKSLCIHRPGLCWNKCEMLCALLAIWWLLSFGFVRSVSTPHNGGWRARSIHLKRQMKRHTVVWAHARWFGTDGPLVAVERDWESKRKRACHRYNEHTSSIEWDEIRTRGDHKIHHSRCCEERPVLRATSTSTKAHNKIVCMGSNVWGERGDRPRPSRSNCARRSKGGKTNLFSEQIDNK